MQSARYSTLYGYANDIVEICDYINLQNCIYIGHSISSMIGLLAAMKRPDAFQKMIFIGPSPRYLNDTDGYYGGFKKADIDAMLDLISKDYVTWAKTVIPKTANTTDQNIEDEIVKVSSRPIKTC